VPPPVDARATGSGSTPASQTTPPARQDKRDGRVT
jgi:hypothetical protein